MCNLRKLLIDRYYPTELVEKLNMTTEEFVDYMWDYITDNIDKLGDEFEIDEDLYE